MLSNIATKWTNDGQVFSRQTLEINGDAEMALNRSYHFNETQGIDDSFCQQIKTIWYPLRVQPLAC